MSSPHQSVPPAKSSHTSDAGSDTGRPEAKVIRIQPLAYLGVVVLALCVFLFFVGWPAALWWLLALPVVVAAWVARTRTVVSDAGLDLRSLFGSRHIDWDQIKGVSIPKRGFVRAHLTDESQVRLPAVSYDQLRTLIAASKGRLPDLFGAAAAAEAERDAEERASAEPVGDAGEGSTGGAESAEATEKDRKSDD